MGSCERVGTLGLGTVTFIIFNTAAAAAAATNTVILAVAVTLKEGKEGHLLVGVRTHLEQLTPGINLKSMKSAVRLSFMSKALRVASSVICIPSYSLLTQGTQSLLLSSRIHPTRCSV